LARSTAVLARFGVEPLEEVGGVVPRLALHLLDQEFLGLVRGQTGDALQLALLRRHELLILRRRRGGGLLALAQRAVAGVELLFEAFDRGLALGDGGLALGEGLLERGGLLAFLARLALESIRISCAFSLASRSASFLRVSASRSASLTIRSACSSARPTVSRRCACG
jgi:hypothetical protein